MARLLRRLRLATGFERTEDLLLLPALEPDDLEPFDGALGDVLRRPRLAYGIPNRADPTISLAPVSSPMCYLSPPTVFVSASG